MTVLIMVPSVSGRGITLECRKAELRERPANLILVPFVKKGPKIDGVLRDSSWKKAKSIHQWLEYPSTAPAAVKAEIRIVSDRKNIYVSYDLSHEKGEDPSLKIPKGGDEYGGSILEVFIDPTGKGKLKYQFCTNPLGLRFDGRNDDKKWNGKWQSVGKVRDDGWSVEMVFPMEDFGKEVIEDEELWEANFGFVLPGGRHNSWTGKWGSTGTDYGRLFFGTAKQYQSRLKPSLSFWLDREVYDLRDVTAVALARVQGLIEADDLVLRLQVMQGTKSVSVETISPLPGLNIDLTLGLSHLPPGKYQINATVLRAGTELCKAARPFEKKKRKLIPEGPKKERISLVVPADRKAAGARYPISTGVPFAQGVLDSPDNVRLLGPDGKEVFCSTGVRSWWNRRGSIQWLGLDFIPTWSKQNQTYLVEYGPDVRRSVTGKLKVDEKDSEIRVTTGPIQFTVSRKRFRLIDSAFLDLNGNGKFEKDESVLKNSDSSGLFLVDHEGNRYESAGDRESKVEVEERGPVKVTIRATGWYVKRGTVGGRTSCELPTDRLCKFTVRLTAYNGLPMVKAAVTTVLTYDSEKVRLRDLGIGFTPVETQKVVIGMDDGRSLEWDAERLKANPFLLQYRWDRCAEDTWRQWGPARGVSEAIGSKTRFLLAARNFWKLFPKEVEWKDGNLLFHVWPAHGRDDAFSIYEQLRWENIYKLWYCHQGQELDFRFPDAYHQTLDEERERTKAFGGYFHAMKYSNAQGLAIHNDFLLNFEPATGHTIAPDQLSYLSDEEPHAVPDPVYTCATGVFGPLLHADTQTFGPVEKSLKDGFHSLATRTLPNNEYGMFIFGGGHTYWYYYKQPMHAGMHRVWINGHYQIARMPFVQYARTGDPLYLRWGRSFSANLRDIGMVHYISNERRFRFHDLGAMYHCKGFAPWAGDSAIAAHPLSIDFLIYDYYLTGNRRSLDVLHEWVEGLKSVSPGGHGTREGIQPLAEMVEAYRLTWDPGLIELMDRFARRVFRQTPLVEQGWWDYHPLLLMRYHGLTGSEEAVQAYRDVVKVHSGGYGGGNHHIDGYLSLLDDSADRLQPYRHHLYRQQLARVDQPGIYANGLTKYVWIRYVYNFHIVPYLLKAMKQNGLQPERPQFTPSAYVPIQEKIIRVIFREEKDQETPVKLAFRSVPNGNFKVAAFDSGGKKVAEKEFASVKNQREYGMNIPADGKADDYLLLIQVTNNYDSLHWPLTPHAREVAVLHHGRGELVGGEIGGRYYFFADKDSPDSISVTSNSKNAMGMELLDADQRVLGRASDSRYVGNPMTLKIPRNAHGPQSIYLTSQAYLQWGGGKRLIVALKPESLFKPKIVREPAK